MNLRFAAIALLSTTALIGCIDHPMNPAATQPATVSDPATTQPSYWYAQASAASVSASDFETLFKTCEDVCREFGFKTDRVDYRSGVLTTLPLESAQFFEPWRPDVQRGEDSFHSSLSSIRRTLRFEIAHKDDGTFEVSPKALVERQTVQERRITNVALYRGAYNREAPQDKPQGSKETDAGFAIPSRYWYSVGRDAALERALVKEINKRIAQKGQSK